jgi:hypothetical protein
MKRFLVSADFVFVFVFAKIFRIEEEKKKWRQGVGRHQLRRKPTKIPIKKTGQTTNKFSQLLFLKI